MKKLYLLPLLFVLITGCKYESNYRSKYEANEACEKWVSKGFKYEYEGYYLSKNGNSRRCRLEAETNQILGFEKKGVKREYYSKYMVEKELNLLKEKVVRHFKF